MSNGVLKAELQELNGVRPIVLEIDSLRIYLGNENVTVQTPRVEMNLRSARLPPKDMQLTCLLPICNNMKVQFTYPIGFPKLPISVAVKIADKRMEGDVQSHAHSVSTIQNENNAYLSSVEILKRITEFYQSYVTSNNCTTRDSGESILDTTETEQIDIENKPNSFANASFSCRICRIHLFDGNDLHEHSIQKISTALTSSIYLTNPPSFLSSEILQENGGKISCHNCGHKLGNLSWAGSKCSCCELWVAPLFQFAASKVDFRLDMANIESIEEKAII